MIHDLHDIESGFDVDCDTVVVGSGAGGAVAAANLSAAGHRVVVLEAGPRVRFEDMTRDAPRFLARNFWDGGLRLIGGTTQSPSLQARCLGGGTVVNSAIMLELPGWVRELWAEESGIELFRSRTLANAYERVFTRCKVAPTPMAVLGRRNLLVRDAIEGQLRIAGGPLPRAVVGCDGCADCLTGCIAGHKQSVDRSYLRDAEADGAQIYVCSEVERVLTRGKRAVGVEGTVIDPRGYRRRGRFRVHAKQIVLAAGTMQTPVLLQRSGINPRDRVGATMYCHIGGGMVGIMDEVVDPWVGATQGWGAISPHIRGLKYEGLWASPSVLMVRWGDVGRPFVERLHEVKHATVIALVYRGRVHGDVSARRNGSPRMRLWIDDDNVRPIMQGMKDAADALLAVGARYVHTGLPGVVDEMRTADDTASLLSPRLRAKHLTMTLNHTFGSCPMSATDTGPVTPEGKLRGLDNVYVCDASVFPSPSAVNPQATIMALADIASRRLGELSLD
ncbi:MAG: GMC family oxidoreductase [Polyangiaceae bacterium]